MTLYQFSSCFQLKGYVYITICFLFLLLSSGYCANNCVEIRSGKFLVAYIDTRTFSNYNIFNLKSEDSLYFIVISEKIDSISLIINETEYEHITKGEFYNLSLIKIDSIPKLKYFIDIRTYSEYSVFKENYTDDDVVNSDEDSTWTDIWNNRVLLWTSIDNIVTEVYYSKDIVSTYVKTSKMVDECVKPERVYFVVSDSADYKNDFNESISRGDFRFVGVLGFTLEVPGVPDYYETYRKSNGVKIIEGTSDSFPDTASLAMDLFYRSYAKGYNSLLLKHLNEDSEKNLLS